MATAEKAERTQNSVSSSQNASKLSFSLAQWSHLIAFAIIGLAVLWPLFLLGRWMLAQDYYQHFPLVICVALGLAIYRIRQNRFDFVGITNLRNLSWTMLALIACVGAYIVPSRWLASLAGIAVLFAVVDFAGGRKLRREMFGPIMLLMAIIPLPVRLDQQFVVGLQQLATRLASLWLDLVGVFHLTTGVQIQTAKEGYYVEDACSGIHSVFAALAVGCGYSVFRGYGFVRLFMIVLQMVLWVVIANALRVFLIVYLQDRVGVDLSSGLIHESLGAITFGVGVLLAISGDHFLRYFSPVAEKKLAAGGHDSEALPTVQFWLDRSLTGPILAGFFAAVLVSGIGVSLAFARPGSKGETPLSTAEMARLAPLELTKIRESDLPADIGEWRRLVFQTQDRTADNVFGGLVSHVWRYNNGARSVLISIDGAYDDWHDLAVCYQANGWHLEEVRPVGSDQINGFVSSDMLLSQEQLNHAQVIFGCVSPTHECVEPPPYFGNGLIALMKRFGTGIGDRPGFRGGVVQLQLMDQQPFSLSEAQQAENRRLYDDVLKHLHQNLLKSSQEGGE